MHCAPKELIELAKYLVEIEQRNILLIWQYMQFVESTTEMNY